MTRRPLLAACGVAALCVAGSLALLRGGGIPGTFASFNGETKNLGSAYAGGWVAAPTPATPTVSGADVGLTWTAGTQGVLSQQLNWADNNTSSDCSAATYAPVGSALSGTATSTTDTGRGSGATNGHYICYRMDSLNNSWVTSAAFTAVRAGFFATAVSITNSSGRLDNGDTFVVTFNQAPATPASTKVCTFASPANVILIGDPSNCASASDTAAFKLSLSSGSLANSVTSYTATYSVNAGAKTLTVTVGGQPTVSLLRTTSSSPAWVFTPQSLTSASGAAAVCATSPSCTPTPTGTF
jgi:hypothetical protein